MSKLKKVVKTVVKKADKVKAKNVKESIEAEFVMSRDILASTCKLVGTVTHVYSEKKAELKITFMNQVELAKPFMISGKKTKILPFRFDYIAENVKWDNEEYPAHMTTCITGISKFKSGKLKSCTVLKSAIQANLSKHGKQVKDEYLVKNPAVNSLVNKIIYLNDPDYDKKEANKLKVKKQKERLIKEKELKAKKKAPVVRKKAASKKSK